MLKRIEKFANWIFFHFQRLTGRLFSVALVEDPVDDPNKNVIYIIGTPDEPWQVELLCPCGCGDKIVLPVNESTSPRWSVHVVSGVPSLSPSVWRTKKCKSHFFLRKGRVEWCG